MSARAMSAKKSNHSIQFSHKINNLFTYYTSNLLPIQIWVCLQTGPAPHAITIQTNTDAQINSLRLRLTDTSNTNVLFLRTRASHEADLDLINIIPA